ncbi:hypothetical protein IMSHALPRED_004760 [Imshaugia aleurites]|uniref:Sodium bile acid symporter family protein n=1 Tax=Imshaugia aleurites TaxID=172621 RepID=A0A8H3FFF9_9LECA|nr:hypothetical protein IMSHALPRED_004760 [Imshaugia aleurites]
MTSSNPPKPKWHQHLSKAKWFLVDQWFLLALGCLILIASQVQVPASQQGQKEIVVTYLCVAVIFITTGCTLPTRVLMQNYSRWKIHLFVQMQSFLMTSAVVYGVVSLCATNRNFMDPGLLVGMIFTGCVPTTISSNIVMTRQAHGNTALTVVQSTLGNLLGPFLSPLLIQIYTASNEWYSDILPKSHEGGYGEIYKRVFKQLGLSIFLPLVWPMLTPFIRTDRAKITQAVGQVVQNIFPETTKRVFIEWKFNRIGSLALLTIIWQTFDQAFATGAFTSVKPDNIIFIVFISITYYVLWTIICISLSIFWLGKDDTIAVAYCVPAKTPAMGVPLSNVMFPGLAAITASKIQIPMVIFQAFQIAGGSLMTIAFRKWIRPDKQRETDAEKAELEGGLNATPAEGSG